MVSVASPFHLSLRLADGNGQWMPLEESGTDIKRNNFLLFYLNIFVLMSNNTL